jgi:hypothetical protein
LTKEAKISDKRGMHSPEQIAEKKEAFIRMIAGGGSWRIICKELATSSATFRQWLIDDAEFQKRYAHATDERADAMFEDMLDIADDGSRDYEANEEGGIVVNHDHIARARLRVDTRKFMLAKMRPKRFGDKLELSGDPDAPVVTNLVVRFVSPKKDDDDA